MEVECEECRVSVQRKKIKRINNKWICKSCYRKKRKERREHLKKELENAQKKARAIDNIPNIKGSKEKKVSRDLHLYLTKEEKDVLYRKYLKKGLEYESIKEKIDRDTKYLRELTLKLKEQNKSEEEISNKFKEEFAKLIEVD